MGPACLKGSPAREWAAQVMLWQVRRLHNRTDLNWFVNERTFLSLCGSRLKEDHGEISIEFSRSANPGQLSPPSLI